MNRQINFRISPEDYAVLQEICNEDGLTVSQRVRWLIKQYLRSNQKSVQGITVNATKTAASPVGVSAIEYPR